jgi:hypothetical protein
VLVDIGGCLGIEEKLVAIDLTALQIKRATDGNALRVCADDTRRPGSPARRDHVIGPHAQQRASHHAGLFHLGTTEKFKCPLTPTAVRFR